MSDYYIINGELYHHGVKGMKWGVRKAKKLEAKATKKYARAGERLGLAQYYESEGRKAKKTHEDLAKAFDRKASKMEVQGKYRRAVAARNKAQRYRSKGEIASAENFKKADEYYRAFEKHTAKAKEFATKKQVDLGKKKVNSIVNDWAKRRKLRQIVEAEQMRRYERDERIITALDTAKEVVDHLAESTKRR